MPSSLANALTTRRSEIEYWELPNYTETWEDHNAGLVRRLACLWSQRQDFILDVVGDANVTGGLLRRDLPEEDRDFAGFYADGLNFVGHAGSPDRDATTKGLRVVERKHILATAEADVTDGLAIYDVTFRRPLYDVADDDSAHADPTLERSRYVIRSGDDISAEALPVYANWLEFEDHKPVGENAAVVFPQGIFPLLWHMVPTDGFPRVAAFGMQGKVNADSFEGFDAETLLFLGAKTTLYQAANTRNYYDVLYTFQHKPSGWNNYLRPNSVPPAFGRVIRKNDPDNGVYLTGNFPDLFNVDLA
jgi:hypothetical protein